MVKDTSIRYLTNTQIDRTAWDHCLQHACNGSPYGLSDYLDALCPGWDALVLGNYEFIMPLPIRSKYGIRYLYQPFLVPHLGLYGPQIVPEMVDRFIKAIPLRIRWIDITLNPETTRAIGSYPIIERANFVVALNSPYSEIRYRYRANHIRNLQRANKAGCKIERQTEPIKVFELAAQYLTPRGHFPAANTDHFLELIGRWMKEGLACTYAVKAGDQLVASAIFLTYRSRAYYLLVGNHPNGKTLGASHLLIDAFIQDHAGSDWVLDFEGSDVPSLAFFYEGFGSKKEAFGWLRINRLPWWGSWIKS
ncbi:MAG: GNAT family N-acetyltransferase [Bacteroidota bacterium]